MRGLHPLIGVGLCERERSAIIGVLGGFGVRDPELAALARQLAGEGDGTTVMFVSPEQLELLRRVLSVAGEVPSAHWQEARGLAGKLATFARRYGAAR